MAVHPFDGRGHIHATSSAAKKLPAPIQAFDSAIDDRGPVERRVSVSVQAVIRQPLEQNRDQIPRRVQKCCCGCLIAAASAFWGFTIYLGYNAGFRNALVGMNCTRV